ncbi:hypothetical protein THRCLA_21090 [Thraustotheca clavata]|uniref:Uncharacterized protein n=1 Tax=Thraustotheca clavata TaxID=74557 RepID=A0A1W0A0C7_9STRA|nr:hypothetical protein THRCLA_21090 [Thraustotheca clavata]
MSYKEFRVDFSHRQVTNVLHGKSILLSHTQLNNDKTHYWHVENYKKLVKAYESGKGVTIHMSHGEVLRTHQSGLDGSGLWGDLWGASTAWNFLKDNWKPIAGTVLDKVADLAAPETGGLRVGMEPQYSTPRRGRRKVGIDPSGSFRLKSF